MSVNPTHNIDASEQQLNSLFREVLDGLRDDICEAQQNVDEYFKVITNTAGNGGRELFGSLYNDSLRIKGAARDRQLKFLNTFKERVAKKEAIQMAKDLKEMESKQSTNSGKFDHTKMNDYLEELKNAGQLPNFELNLDDLDKDE